MSSRLFKKVNLLEPSQLIVDRLNYLIANTEPDQFGQSPVADAVTKWYNSLDLLQKSGMKFQLNSGLIQDSELIKLINNEFKTPDTEKSLVSQYFPEGKGHIWSMVQHCCNYPNGNFVGISCVPINWVPHNRGKNLIYTFPEESWTIKFYKVKPNGRATENSVMSYDDVELVEEHTTNGGGWYFVDFTQPLLTEEVWNNRVTRIILKLT